MPTDQRTVRAVVEEYTRLLSLAVHEFRTPASVVGGYLRMLLGEAGGPLTDHQRKMVEEAERSCERIVALISELNEIARLDGGSAATGVETFDLFQVVREASRDIRNAEDREVPIDFLGEAVGARCTGDRARLSAALAAIIRAIAREQVGGAAMAIDCRLTSDKGRRLAAVIVARDRDVQSTFTAPREAFDERRGGLGLALPIARRVIERHGGQVWSPAVGMPDAAARRAGAVIAMPLT